MELRSVNQGEIKQNFSVKYQKVNTFEDQEAELKVLCRYDYNHLKYGN